MRLLRDGVFERGLDVFLADQLRERLRPVFAGDDLIHERRAHEGAYARPRVIRGTRVKPLPLLPSGPGGVCSRPLHEARSLTTSHASSFEIATRRFRERTFRPEITVFIMESDSMATVSRKATHESSS